MSEGKRTVAVSEDGIFIDGIPLDEYAANLAKERQLERIFPEGSNLAYDIFLMFVKNNVTVEKAQRILDEVKEFIPTCATIVRTQYTTIRKTSSSSFR